MNTSDGTGIIQKMKYCKCVKPKEWEGDNYCRRCNGFIESRINTRKIKMFRFISNGDFVLDLMGLHYYASGARERAEKVLGEKWKDLYKWGGRVVPIHVVLNPNEGIN